MLKILAIVIIVIVTILIIILGNRLVENLREREFSHERWKKKND